MDVMRRDHATPTAFPAASTASGLTAVMLEKEPRQWDLVWRALRPLVILSNDATDLVRTVDGQRLRYVKMAAKLQTIRHPMDPLRVRRAA